VDLKDKFPDTKIYKDGIAQFNSCWELAAAKFKVPNIDEVKETCGLLFSSLALFLLSYLISERHTTYPRYPGKKVSPIDRYNETHILVVNYLRLHEILEKCLLILAEETYKDKY
jgi:hypothetical protein